MTNLLNLEIIPFESTNITRTYTEWRSPLLLADCVYIQTFEELDRGGTELSEKEREAEFFNAEMKTKWDGLRKQQLDFLTDVQKYDQFFRENERKFRRVSANITAELVVQGALELDIDTCRRRNEYLFCVLQKMENSVNVLIPYNTFVGTLVRNERAPEYDLQNIDSLENLIASISQNKLHDQFSNALFEHENLSSQMQQWKMMSQDEFSKQTNDLFHTERRLNKEKENLLLFRTKLCRLRKENEKSELVVGLDSDEFKKELNMFITHHNIYRLLCEWKKIFHLCESEDSAQEISYIGYIVNELRCILKQAQDIFSKRNLSDEADSSFMTLHQRL